LVQVLVSTQNLSKKLLKMNIITVTTRTFSGGDFVSLHATQCADGWLFEVHDSCGLEYTLPADTLSEIPDVDGMMKFIDAIRMDGEPNFRGLVLGFLEMNFPADRKLSVPLLKEARGFLKIESSDFPELVKDYELRVDAYIDRLST